MYALKSPRLSMFSIIAFRPGSGETSVKRLGEMIVTHTGSLFYGRKGGAFIQYCSLKLHRETIEVILGAEVEIIRNPEQRLREYMLSDMDIHR